MVHFFRLSLPEVSGSSQDSKYLSWFDLDAAAWRKGKKSHTIIELNAVIEREAPTVFFTKALGAGQHWPEAIVSVAQSDSYQADAHQAEVARVVFSNTRVRELVIQGRRLLIVFEADKVHYKIGSRAIW